MKEKVTVPAIRAAKGTGRCMTMVTSYSYIDAAIVDRSNVEMILVGDSLGMIQLGYSGTVGVTLDDIIHHTKPVVKGAPHTFVIGDMPFGTYNGDINAAIANATRLFTETGCDAVKLEGGIHTVPYIEAIVNAGIPVAGHVGLTPQTAAMMGGFKVQGKSRAAAEALVELIQKIEAAGAFMCVVEGVPVGVAKAMTEAVSIPTMGIGAGRYTDFQNLVFHDLLGYSDRTPKFVKRYANIAPVMIDALNKFSEEANAGTFPTEEYSYNTVVEGFELE